MVAFWVDFFWGGGRFIHFRLVCFFFCIHVDMMIYFLFFETTKNAFNPEVQCNFSVFFFVFWMNILRVGVSHDDDDNHHQYIMAKSNNNKQKTKNTFKFLQNHFVNNGKFFLFWNIISTKMFWRVLFIGYLLTKKELKLKILSGLFSFSPEKTNFLLLLFSLFFFWNS